MRQTGIRILVILGVIEGFRPAIGKQRTGTYSTKQNVGQPEDFLVRDLPGAGNVLSYSGYFQVNTKYNSNIFFWFFPAQVIVEIMYLQSKPNAR